MGISPVDRRLLGVGYSGCAISRQSIFDFALVFALRAVTGPLGVIHRCIFNLDAPSYEKVSKGLHGFIPSVALNKRPILPPTARAEV
jgi:hypothetical protein